MTHIWFGRSPFQGNRIERDATRITSAQVTERQRIPYIDSTNLPPPTRPGVGGGIAYDRITDRPYYSDGFSWFPIGGGGGGGNVDSYSFIKNGNQNISSSTETGITAYSTAGSSTYHTLPGWNLTTGEYTAPQNEILSVCANISWAANVSNQGLRMVRIQYDDGGGYVTIKEVDTQADPATAIETTQECQIHLQLSAGDKVRIAAFHDAPISIPIVGGNHTSVCGFRTNV